MPTGWELSSNLIPFSAHRTWRDSLLDLNTDNRNTHRARRRSPWKLPQEEIDEIQSLARSGLSRRQIAKDRDLSLGVVGKYAKGIKLDPNAPIGPAAGQVLVGLSDQKLAELRSLIARIPGAQTERQEESVKPSASPQPLDSSKEMSVSARYPGLSSVDIWHVSKYGKVCDLIAKTSRFSIVQENPGTIDDLVETKRLFEVALERRGLTRYLT